MTENKKLLITRLEEEIAIVNFDELEYIGHHLLCVLKGEHLNHPGMNSKGRPVGYTVDIYSDDMKCIGECSVEEGYFSDYKSTVPIDDNYTKITKDINHALNFSKYVEEIYLFSSQVKIPSFQEHFGETQIYSKTSNKLHIYGLNDLAEEIYRQSVNSVDNYLFYKQFFPSFSSLFETFNYDGKIPPLCEKYVREPKIIGGINDFLNQKSICVLSGVSGSGKTQSVIDFVRESLQDYDSCIWLEGDEWKENQSLSSIRRSRGGAPINIAGLFNNHRTLLVVDNLLRNVKESLFAELSDGFKLGGKVIVTTQLYQQSEIYLQIPEYSDQTAQQILGDADTSNINSIEIIKKCKSVPIILSTIRGMVEERIFEKNDLYEAVLNNPNELTGNDGTSILETILHKLEPKTRDSLSELAKTGVTLFDYNYLKRIISPLTIQTFFRLSFLQQIRVPGIWKLHDLLALGTEPSEECLHCLNDYIAETKGEMTSSVLRQCYILRERIENYKQTNEALDWLTYALLQIESNNNENRINRIQEKEFSEGMSFEEIMCLIEAKEQYALMNRNVDYCEQLLKSYSDLIPKIDDESLRAELLHHKGKIHRRIKQFSEAYKCYNSALALKPNGYEIYLQKVIMGKSPQVKELGITAEVESAYKWLLSRILSGDEKIPLRVMLQTISNMSSYREVVSELIDSDEKRDIIFSCVINAAIGMISQYYEAVMAITSFWHYQYPEKCIDLLKMVEIESLSPETIEDFVQIKVCEALSNIAEASERIGRHKDSEIFCGKSIEFAQCINDKAELKLYDYRVLAKTFIIAKDFETAIGVINKVDEDKRDHWILYRQAQAEKELSKQESVHTAKRAIDLLEKDSKNIYRKPAYLALLSDCYKVAGDINKCLSTLKEAIDSTNGKYKAELENRFLELQKSLKDNG